MRIACPPIIGSCYYGVDPPTSEKLISNRMSGVDQIRDFIGCDSLAFLPLDSLTSSFGPHSSNFCYACFSGVYPLPLDPNAFGSGIQHASLQPHPNYQEPNIVTL
ncbi:hypothetical protein Ahy_A08g037824 [Arachis hypogaea]|uniref:Amidophosphoribosyltransferase n=1 Tax=Arachis hypogaea TaxID=3818 RepID=A0A445BRX2_ARAHY|nr:hypothetical protein Ahy_A08g037824 [Arachis hypogaea]